MCDLEKEKLLEHGRAFLPEHQAIIIQAFPMKIILEEIYRRDSLKDAKLAGIEQSLQLQVSDMEALKKLELYQDEYLELMVLRGAIYSIEQHLRDNEKLNKNAILSILDFAKKDITRVKADRLELGVGPEMVWPKGV